MIRITNDPTKLRTKINVPKLPFDFTIDVTRRQVVISGSVDEQQTIRDRVVDVIATATIDNEADVIVHETTPLNDYTLSVENLDPSIATMDENGKLIRLTNGVVRVVAKSDFLTRRVNVPIYRTTGLGTSTFNRFKTGSLCKHANDAVYTLFNGKNATTTKPIFTSMDHTNGVYVRNPSVWTGEVNLTGFSPWNSSGGNRQAGTLVSPRHLVVAEHYPYWPGTTVRFVKNDNTVVTRTVTATEFVGPSNFGDEGDQWRSDIAVCLLDSDVPTGIAFHKVLPTNWETVYMPGTYEGVYAITTNQQKHACVGKCTGSVFTNESGYETREKIHFQLPSSNDVAFPFFDEIVTGDSGSPSFFIINGEAVLLTSWTFGGGGTGPVYGGGNVALINAAMTTLGGGYTLTPVNLSGFAL